MVCLVLFIAGILHPALGGMFSSGSVPRSLEAISIVSEKMLANSGDIGGYEIGGIIPNLSDHAGSFASSYAVSLEWAAHTADHTPYGLVLIAEDRHILPCGWTTVSNKEHPERPPQLILDPGAHSCVQSAGKQAAVHVASGLSMIYRTQTARATIHVTALEDGAIGQTIRCRSSIDGAILLGRVTDAESVEMLPSERTLKW